MWCGQVSTDVVGAPDTSHRQVAFHSVTKIPIFLEPANPLPENIDAWAERVAEQIEAAITAIEGHGAPPNESPGCSGWPTEDLAEEWQKSRSSRQ